MALSFSMLLQNFGTNGFIEATIQREEINHKQVSTLHWINVAINLTLTLLFMASAPLIAWFYKEPLLKPIVLMIAIPILLGGVSTQHQALLRRNMEFYKIAACDIGATLASLGIAILLAYWGWGYWALVARWIASPLVTAAGSWLLCGWRPTRPARGTGVRPMLSFALHTYGNFVLFYFCKTVDKMLVGRAYGSQALGNYDRAYQLSNMLPSQLLSPLNSVAMPAFSRLANDPAKYRQTYLNLLSVLAFVSMPASAVLTLTGKDLILLLLGPQWKSAGPIFSVFGLSIGVLILYSTHAWLHLSLGTPDRWLRWAVIAFIVTLLLFVAGLRFGPLGVATGYSAALYILTGPAIWYAGRPIHLKLSSVISGVWKAFASALGAGLLCRLVMSHYVSTASSFISSHLLVGIVVSSTLCISIYLGLVLALHRSMKPLKQLSHLLRDMIPRMPSRG